MSKDSRFQYKYRSSASRLHRKVGDLLRSDINFKHLPSFQEYPTYKVNPEYQNKSHRFDWVIPRLRLVIECHGKQHSEPTAFDGNIDKAVEMFKDGQRRDREKKKAALAGGWTYIVVNYNDKITPRLIFDKIKLANKELKEYKTNNLSIKQEDRLNIIKERIHKQRLRLSNQIRKQRYKKLKEIKDGLKR